MEKKKRNVEIITLFSYQEDCKRLAKKWDEYANELQEVSEVYRDAYCIKSSSANFIVSPSADSTRISLIPIRGRQHFQLCSGVLLSGDKPVTRAVFPEKIATVDAIKALVIFREKHPESFEQLRKIIEEHSEPVGLAAEVLPFVV